MSTDHLSIALRVKLAENLLREFIRWTDETNYTAAQAHCFYFVTHGSETAGTLADLLMQHADDQMTWLEESAEVSPSAKRDEHRKRNRKDCEKRMRDIIKRHHDAVRAAEDAGIF